MMGKKRKKPSRVSTPRPRKFNKPSGEEKLTRTRSDSYESSGGETAVATNQDLIVFVNETTTTDSKKPVFLLSISNVRSRTALGKNQGDHVTAYRALLEMLVIATEGYNIKDVRHSIMNTIVSIIPDEVDQFNELIKKISEREENSFSRDQRVNLTKALESHQDESISKNIALIEKVQENLLFARKAVHMESLREISQLFIEKINLEDKIAFTRTTASDPAEGVKVKLAVHALKAMSDLTSLRYKFEIQKSEYFYKNYLKVGAPYLGGINHLFGDSKNKELITNRSSRLLLEEIEQIFDLIEEKDIAKLFGEMFDFKQTSHFEKDEDIILEVTSKHLVIMFNAFEGLKEHHGTNDIIKCFLKEQVLIKMGWENAPFFKVDTSSSVSNTNSLFVDRDRVLKEQVAMIEDKLCCYADLKKFSMLSESQKMQALSAEKNK